jgi:diguanylate cyclase (GGDEF)-like protein/PAS domain S-box-containing protein
MHDPVARARSRGNKRRGLTSADREPDVVGFAESTELALMCIDAEGVITYVNAASERMFGHERAEMLGHTLDLIIPPRLRGAHHAGVARVGEGAPSKLAGRSIEVMALRADGTEFPIEVSLSAWRGNTGTMMGAVMRDISERRQRDSRLHRLAHHDPLTGLPNRFQFNLRLEEILSSGEQAAVLLIDLDGFKKVNDSLGHATGDTLLQALAVRVPAALEANAMFARFGGDEFAVLMPGIGDPLKASAAARTVLGAFGPAFNIGDHLLKLGASIGVAIGPMHGDDPEELVASADLALYQAKHGGNSVRLFESSMRSAVAARRAIRDELLRAVSDGELVLYYQPQVNMESGSILGAEALLRWNHPTRGLLLPGKFLEALESHSLALQVGCWIIDEACKQASAWRVLGLPALRMSVNLFAAQVNAGNLAEVVEETLKRYSLPPEALELEVTETVMLHNDDHVLRPFERLRERRVRIAFDDFGTGHASLSMLKRFPLTTIKIDRGFVRDLLADRYDAAIVQALLGLARAMGLDAVAEGVETKEQEAVLLALGCKIGQGYLYARALPAEEFTRLFGRLRTEENAAVADVKAKLSETPSQTSR